MNTQGLLHTDGGSGMKRTMIGLMLLLLLSLVVATAGCSGPKGEGKLLLNQF